MLSTQSPLNNPISTTYPISNLSTQLSHPKSSGYVSAQYNKQKIREPEQFFQTVPTLGNPLFSALFRYSISPPVTSTRHTPRDKFAENIYCSRIVSHTMLSQLHIYSIYENFNIQSFLNILQYSSSWWQLGGNATMIFL